MVHRPVRAGAGVVGGELGSSLYRLLEGRTWLDGSSLRWRISLGPSSGQGVGGGFGSEGLVAGEHVPDRFGEAAGEVDLATLAPRACRFGLWSAGSGRYKRDGCKRGWRPRRAPSAGSGDPAWRVGRVGRARPIGRRVGRAPCSRRVCADWGSGDVAEFGGDRVGEHPADSGDGAEQRHVAVVGAEPA